VSDAKSKYQTSMHAWAYHEQMLHAQRWAAEQVERMLKEGYVETFPGHFEKHDEKTGRLVAIVTIG
jgi:hypothetical protein